MIRAPSLWPVTLAVLLVAGPAAAQTQPQYKVVGPDGSVTYTDRPPTATNARITPLNRRAEAPAAAGTDADAALPFELRQATTRFPVTLYTAPDCAPCDAGRQLLQQRGVPFAERHVTSRDDAAALERAVGGRTVPALTVGQQALRGLSPTDWTSYLDAAGYPRESRLPRSYQAPASAPLAARSAPAAGDSVAAPPEPPERPARETPAAPAAPASAIRF